MSISYTYPIRSRTANLNVWRRHLQVSSDEGAAVAGRARLHRREEPSPVQAGAAGVGELRLSEAALTRTPRNLLEATESDLH